MPPSPLSKFHVVCLPDFFLDAIVRLPRWDAARKTMGRIAQRGGGNWPVGPVEFKAGGNATNTAVALSHLGARTTLITETNALGMHLLKEAARGTPLDLSHVRVGRATGATLALEFGGANVMLSHRGPLDGFGPERLTASDWRAMKGADAVVVTNWAQNSRGTALLKAVARRLPRPGPFLYVDTSDPRHRGADGARLMREKAVWRRVDAWSLNENELRAFSGARRGKLENVAQRLSDRLGCRLDFHTRTWAATITSKHVVRVEGDRAKARRITGAGDAWNAGNVAGCLLGLPDADRLRLAHAVATAFVTSDDGRPTSWRELPSRFRRSKLWASTVTRLALWTT